MQIANKIINYFLESRTELKKVVWPTKRETTNHTLLVIGISLGMGIFFAVLDYVFTVGLEKIITR
jgi:preprotein translocase subunit SecE